MPRICMWIQKYGVLSHDNEKSHSFSFSHDHGPFPSNPVLCHGKQCFVLDHTEVGILSWVHDYHHDTELG